MKSQRPARRHLGIGRRRQKLYGVILYIFILASCGCGVATTLLMLSPTSTYIDTSLMSMTTTPLHKNASNVEAAVAISKNCFCGPSGQPTSNRIYPEGNWICAGINGTLPTKSYWQSSDQGCASSTITPQSACEALLQFGEVVFAGDSISRQFFQGLLVLLTNDWQSGSLWDAKLNNHHDQWDNTNWWRWWPSGGERQNTNPRCQGAVQQFDERCRMNVILDTTNVKRICDGRLRMRFWHTWHKGEGFEQFLSTVIPNLAPHSLVVTNTGMHPGFRTHIMRDWMNRILGMAPPDTHIVWHANDPPSEKKPKQFLPHQGREVIHTALLNNIKEIDELQGKFPQLALDLISFWNITEKANEQCIHDTTLASRDGTHYPLSVNEEKARQLMLLIQEDCAAIKLKKREVKLL